MRRMIVPTQELMQPDTVESGQHRVNRGGSWNSTARNVRAANRNRNDPGNRNDNLGFRLVRAQRWAGWPAPDQTAVPSRSQESGEYKGRRCASRASPNAHRRPTFFERVRSW